MTLGPFSIDLNNPATLAVLGAGVVVFVMLMAILRVAGRSAQMAEPILRELEWMTNRVQSLSEGQERLAGGLHHVADQQASSQTNMLHLMEQRLAEVQRQMTEALHGTSTRTARSLGDLQQRLETIDRAQANLEKLS